MKKLYRVNPRCLIDGHLMDDGSLPTCMRHGCDEGMQMVDYYLDLEDETCRCDEGGFCGWHDAEERQHDDE